MKKAVKAGIFSAILIVLIVLFMNSGLAKLTGFRGDQVWSEFYAEKKDSLDAIYIGSSNAYVFWAPPASWENYGYTVFSLSTPKMPIKAVKYVMQETKKTQSDALYIICLNSLKNPERITLNAVHSLLDYMKYSSVKSELIDELYAELDQETISKRELYFPLLRFHGKLVKLKSADAVPYKKIKGAYDGRVNREGDTEGFFEKSIDVTQWLYLTDDRAELTQEQDKELSGLLDYCEESGANVLFVIVPQYLEHDIMAAQFNTMSDQIRSRGFTVLNLFEEIDETGLDYQNDYYDRRHTGIHGCLKYTRFLSEYLKENYGFEDKRGQSAYADWDKVCDVYSEMISPYTLDFEREYLPRTDSLEAPELKGCTSMGTTIHLSWKKAAGADKYRVYRRMQDGETGEWTAWEQVGEVPGDKAVFDDPELEINTKYNYTVVPVRMEGETEQFGKFSYAGISSTTRLPAPELRSIKEDENGITITWDAVEGAEGYTIYRKAKGESFAAVDTVEGGDVLSYTDRYYKEDLTYIYSVGAYQKIDDDVKEGYYHRKGLSRK